MLTRLQHSRLKFDLNWDCQHERGRVKNLDMDMNTVCKFRVGSVHIESIDVLIAFAQATAQGGWGEGQAEVHVKRCDSLHYRCWFALP